MNVDETRNRILDARERRAALRRQCSQTALDTVSLSLNIPGYPKSTPLLSGFFDDVLSECKRFLQACGIPVIAAREMRLTDDAGDFYLAPIGNGHTPRAIKALAETFEERHPLGRLIDIDVADRRLQPVSSGKLKQCLLCEKPAVVCMREGNHTHEELREHLERAIRSHLAGRTKRRVCRELAALALKAILYEISASPKPGLVGRFEQGAHHDMDYFTFIGSTSAIAGYFEELAGSGYGFQDGDLRGALPVIRAAGLKMEASMFSATGGVNTQKGLIFLIGLALFSAARCIARDGVFAADRCRAVIRSVCAGLVKNELTEQSGEEETHGKICFRRYGPEEGGGVRKEAESGLPSVFDHGLPELKAALSGVEKTASAAHINRSLIQTLLRLMTVTNDSNILYRKDLRTLKTVQRLARHVLDAEDRESEAERYGQLLNFCRSEHVSPGGSADLLAVTVFLHFVERSFSAPPNGGNAD